MKPKHIPLTSEPPRRKAPSPRKMMELHLTEIREIMSNLEDFTANLEHTASRMQTTKTKSKS